jgi:diamine N-acetyltransferase
MDVNEEPIGQNARVTLREIKADTVRSICRLSDTLSPDQQKMVAPNAVSIAQAHFEPKAWFRAVYADDTPVGFIMLYEDLAAPHVYLWRFMIAGPHQGKGFGRRALELAIAHAKTRPDVVAMKASYVPIEGGAGPFYRKLGFEPTGETEGEEVVIRLALR